MLCRKTCKGTAQGFTLVELLVVLVILGLLGGVVGPRVIRHLGGAKVDTARLQVDDLGAALDIYHLEVGRYPSTSEGLAALVGNPGNAPGWNGPYLKKKQIPKDPWGNDFVYRSPGDGAPYDLISYGGDGAPGGDGEDADIISWE